MSVTIWDDFANDGAGGIATRTPQIGWTEPEGDEAPEPIHGDPVPLVRIAGPFLGLKYGDWARPVWQGTPAQADPAGAGALNFLPGERILVDVDVKPEPGVGQKRSDDHDGGVADLENGRMVWTWSLEAVGDGAAVESAWAAAGAAAMRRVEAAAEQERGKYLTPGTGKAMTYQAKRAEAERYAADQDPQDQDYPFAAAEAAVRETTVAAVIDLWAVNIAAWGLQLGPAIEAAEQGAKVAIAAAVAAQDAEALAAAEAVTWPSPG